MTPAALLYRLAGCPPLADTLAATPCWLCGAPALEDRGVDRVRWEGANFTDQNKARAQSSPIVCEPCAWACSWVPPPGYPPAGDGRRGVNLRLFSHCYDAGIYAYGNKACKPWLLAWLRSTKHGPWFCAIADSGQKHTLPWTPLNLSGGVAGLVRFEEQTVALGEWSLCDAMTALLTRGVTKDEITTGRYRVASYQHSAVSVRTFEADHGAARGGGWFTLCLWLAQRDEAEHAAVTAARRGQHGRPDGGARAMGARGPGGVSGAGRVKPVALGADRDADAGGGEDDHDGQRVGDAHAARPADCGGKQIALFGDRAFGRHGQ